MEISRREKLIRLKARREGGAVERCHTVPHSGGYTNGHHSYNLAQIILTFHPDPSLNLIRASLDHDVPERWVGDTPATAKWNNPALKQALMEAEAKVEKRLGLDYKLTENEVRWLKAADILEIYIWAKEQCALGNLCTQTVVSNVCVLIAANDQLLPRELVNLFNLYSPRRLSDDIDNLED